MALLPQLELRDSFNFQIFPEGMHVFHLPFSDDIRCPEADSSVVGPDVSEEGVRFWDEKAADLGEASQKP